MRGFRIRADQRLRRILTMLEGPRSRSRMVFRVDEAQECVVYVLSMFRWNSVHRKLKIIAPVSGP